MDWPRAVFDLRLVKLKGGKAGVTDAESARRFPLIVTQALCRLPAFGD